MRRTLGLLLASALACVGTVIARADDFYRGKSINFVVGFGAGAGMDTTARTIARHLPRFIPGAPNVLVQQMEGAAGLIAANHVAHRVAPDGLTIAAPGRSFFIEPLVGTASAQFDPVQLGYVGGTGAQNTILWTAAASGARDYNGLLSAREPLALGALGTGTPGAIVASLLAESGARIRIVTGYNSAARLIIALAQGELQSVFLSEDSFATQREVIDNGIAMPVLQSRPVKPGVRLIGDVLPAARRQTLDLAQAGESLGLIIITPPGVPRERLDILRKAFMDMSADPAYQADIARFDPGRMPAISGGAVAAYIADLARTMTPAAIADFNRLRH
jgi:tripartite-type tricarboxylate transporter receptor subunit TctC